MRTAFLALALASVVGCGAEEKGPDLSGNWDVEHGRDGALCTGAMTLTQSGDSLSGTEACGGVTATVTGVVNGSQNISLTLSVPGAEPALMVGTFYERVINGNLNGSGYTGQAFKATKHR